MNKVLLFNTDTLFKNQLLCDPFKTKHTELEFLYSDDIDKAINILSDRKIDLLICDISAQDLTSLQFLSSFCVNHLDIPCIIITSYSLPLLTEHFLNDNFLFVQKPVSPSTLFANLHSGKAYQSSEKSELPSLPQILKFVQMESQTCFIEIHHENNHAGRIFFYNGKFRNAVYDNLTGEIAVIKLLSIMDKVTIRELKLPEENMIKQIDRNFDDLYQEAMRLKTNSQPKDHTHSTTETALKKLGDWGIYFCERLEFNKAMKYFANFIKKDPSNAFGWLWLSRTLVDIDKIKKALARANKLLPNQPDIQTDIRKVRSLTIQQDSALTHCPFCYSPVYLNSNICHYCHSNLLTEPSALNEFNIRMVNKHLVRQATNRLERVLAYNGQSVKLLFYTGTAYLNLDEPEKAKMFFEKLAPLLNEENCLTINSCYKKTVALALEQIQARLQQEKNNTAVQTETSNNQKEKKENQQKVSPFNGKTVLVVEDSPTTRKVIKMTLQKGGFNVIEAGDGVEALVKVNDKRPNLVLLDIMLPKIDGYNVLSILRKNREMENIPIIMLTSKNTVIDKVKGRLSAADKYLTKPFKPEELVTEVQKFIN